MDEADVTIIRLVGYLDRSTSSTERFHDVPIQTQTRLEPRDRDQIVALLRQIAAREDRDEAEAQRLGQVTGGVWGCVSGTLGIRFTVAGQSSDFFVECGLWLRPADDAADGPSATRIVFTEEEGERFMSVVSRL